MNEGRLVIATFCDDIRQEQGNKHSLMGCYSSELICSQMPVVLPKFCAQVTAITPFSRPFEKLVIRAFFAEDLLAEFSIPSDHLLKGQEANLKRRIEDATRHVLQASIVLTPLPLAQPGIIRVEAETEEGTLKGNSLRVRAAADEQKP